MAVKIRLARFGCRNRPTYRLVAADSKSRREGKSLEVLGHYDPQPCLDGIKLKGLKYDRVRSNAHTCISRWCQEIGDVQVGYWLSVGAQPSETACHLLNRTGQFQPLLPVLAGAHKGQTPDSQSSDPLSGCYKTPEVDGAIDQPNEDEGSLTCLLAYPLP